MRTSRQPSGARGFALGLTILAVGIAIGIAIDGPSGDGARLAGARTEGELHRLLRPAAEPPPAAENDLPTLTLQLPPDSARVMQEVRDRAMERGVIVQTDADTVPATLEHEGRAMAADVRIKGDWIDHVATDKWSLRIELIADRLFGMRRFSIQSPHTRGGLWEWLVLEMARREDVLAPRARFVNVVVNGNPAGVYYLEEHFSKELLEAQGRREGPIVVFDESTLWSSMLQAHAVLPKGVDLPLPATAAPGERRGVEGVGGASVRAYGEKRLSESEALSGMLHGAVTKMRQLQQRVVAADSAEDRLRRLQAMALVQGRLVDDLVDTDRLACAHALATLLELGHPLVWHNLRFYHDPLKDRLEPIMFDNMAHEPAGRDPVMFRGYPLIEELATSDAYYEGVFRYLGRFASAAYLDDLMADLEPELRRFEAALAADGPLPASWRVDAIKQRLRTQQLYLRQVVFPRDPVNFQGAYDLETGASDRISGTVHVDAWATTRTPVVVEGFRFGNGSRTVAAAHLGESDQHLSRTASGGVVLPRDGRAARFSFAFDERLANLQNVQQIKDAIRTGIEPRGSLELDITAVFHSIVTDEESLETVRFRRRHADAAGRGGRPPAPTIAEALERHPFLLFQPETGHLALRPGEWDVDGDLVAPAGVTLVAEGPVTLRFAPDAVLVSDAPLRFTGTAERPVVLGPREPGGTWKGIAVIGAGARSEWTHVRVESTDAVSRGGWVTTGGVTFYGSPISMTDCHIAGTVAEDGTNVFGADMHLLRVTFSGCASDSFDGDFVTGRVDACTFEDGAADGVDFSGSDVVVAGCTFRRLEDKAVSAGEDSRVRVVGGVAEDVSIGVAAKDRSDVFVRGLRIRRARNYALAAFVKKPEFGPSRMEVVETTIEGSGLGDAVAQTGCVIEIDGRVVETQDLDVERLYAEGVLGK